MSYTPLHVHSSYSIRDAVIRIEDYVKKVKDLGLTAACVTDHGFMGGVYKLYKECKSQGVKPLFGCEFYYAENAEDKGENYHLVLIAKNNDGYRDLCTLLTYAYTRGFYKKPRIDKRILGEVGTKNLICTTACIFGKAQQLILNNQMDQAILEIEDLQALFGEDLYLEIADHELEDESVVRTEFRQLGQEKKIKIVPATDSHYLNASDKEFHNIFKQIAYNSVGTANDDSFPGTGYHIWTYDEMQKKFPQEEIDATNEIADKCKVSFDFSRYYMPEFKGIDETDQYVILKKWAYEGLKLKGFDGNKKYVDRLEYELNMLHLMNLESYFLIVADTIRFCREAGIPTGPGRGSAAGVLIGYLIGITKVDPIQYDLLFSRAINPGRSLQYDFGLS